METLIKKAIEAIKAEKKEYAMGLLEGVLEMTLPGPVKQVSPAAVVSILDAKPRSKDEGVMIDAQAAAKLNEIKRLALQGLQ